MRTAAAAETPFRAKTDIRRPDERERRSETLDPSTVSVTQTSVMPGVMARYASRASISLSDDAAVEVAGSESQSSMLSWP